MADWILYSPKMRLASAGELLRCIPSDRIWRLERTFVEDGKDTAEMVRAAEQLLDLDVTLRLQNDPGAATSLKVRQPTDEDRRTFSGLGRDEFLPNDLAVIAEVTLSQGAIDAGHLEIADEVLCGLGDLYRTAIAHSPHSGEVVAVKELVRLMSSDDTRCTHLDLMLVCEDRQQAFVARKLRELPHPFGRYLRVENNSLLLRTRFPVRLDRDQVDSVCSVAMDMAQYASEGHVRFRERGYWRHAVQGIGSRPPTPVPGAPAPAPAQPLAQAQPAPSTAPAPAKQKQTPSRTSRISQAIVGRLSRMFKDDES